MTGGQKPKGTMKNTAKWLEVCATGGNCSGCHYRLYPHCQELLMHDAAWYLQMTVEKSARGQKKEAGYE